MILKLTTQGFIGNSVGSLNRERGQGFTAAGMVSLGRFPRRSPPPYPPGPLDPEALHGQKMGHPMATDESCKGESTTDNKQQTINHPN